MKKFQVSSYKFQVRLHALAPAASTRNLKLETKNSSQRGFTVIELMIATTIFSLVLLLAVAGILHITRLYYQGVTQARTQEVARSIVEEISESIRFSKAGVVEGYALSNPGPEQNTSDHVGFYCVGNKRYTFAIDRQLDSSLPDAPPAPTTKHKRHVLWADQPTTSCAPAPGGSSAQLDIQNPSNPDPEDLGRELLADNMRLTRFEIVPIPAATDVTLGTETYRVSVGVAYGDDDLFRPVMSGDTSRSCQTDFAGSEFCAVSNLSVTVTKRL